MFEKILVPLDGSDHSLNALEQAVAIAEKFSSKITLMHVYSVQPMMMPVDPSSAVSPTMPVIAGPEISTIIEGAKKLGNRILEDGNQRIESSHLNVQKVLVEGHTVEEIVRVANEGNFSLVVLGARGVSHMREMLLGSVTDGVIHHVRCPVLVVK